MTMQICPVCGMKEMLPRGLCTGCKADLGAVDEKIIRAARRRLFQPVPKVAPGVLVESNFKFDVVRARPPRPGDCYDD
jgi:hypothetical protein